ncbi:polysaccharide deacetylase family protein [Microbispora bryophytorum]|uniref:Deacetylase n=1 Tax=Microbispora bryophytorum TaxID=1460882 RepID=A0A8H9L9Y8_9ACTN|nr:polysaccharide deacetylase family protein [Microbispora bryophytorum]MBD3135991.1 polysaccharide deacetylase family protein [Microbispora bryophytorum]TQS07755.1 polysaccharide deacetylase family protein [Microbispora bryophytorum]GGO03869.1 deacetylase [Microbispora bryophytorum]
MAVRRLIPLAVACALAAATATPAQARGTDEPYCATHKCIALTFDDGPGPYVQTLLKTLSEYKAKATFFVIGSEVKKHPKLTQLIAKSGHEIGNHSWDGTYLTSLKYAEINKKIGDTQRLIQKTTGKAPKLFRAPGGLRNGGVEEITAKFGLLQVPGTTATKDYIKDYRHVDFLTNRALDVAGEGEVVLMHETVKETVESMPEVLQMLTAEGYSFVTVSTLLEGQELTPGQVYPDQPGVETTTAVD